MNLFFLIAGGIILLAIVIGFVTIFHKRKRHKAIIRYEKIRDKLTLREPEPEVDKYVEDIDSLMGGPNLSSLIGGVITLGIMLVVGMTILSTMGEVLNEASMEANVTSEMMEAFTPLMDWLPILMVVGIAAMIMGVVFSAFGGALSSTGDEGTTFEEAKSGIEEYKDMRNKLSTKRNT